jgi:hypothetical protein
MIISPRPLTKNTKEEKNTKREREEFFTTKRTFGTFTNHHEHTPYIERLTPQKYLFILFIIYFHAIFSL